MPVNQESVEAPKVPTTIPAWRARVAELENDLVAAERNLVERSAERRAAAGAALVYGAEDTVVVELDAAERDAERRVDSLRCAVALAQGELQKLVEAEHRARIEAQRQRRQTVAAEIQQHAIAVDGAFALAADHLEAISALLVEYWQAGGAFTRSLKGCTTRAIKANPALREFVLTEFVGGHEHLRPLAEQLGALAVTPGADERFGSSEAAPDAPNAA
jgi:hypothetical protein